MLREGWGGASEEIFYKLRRVKPVIFPCNRGRATVLFGEEKIHYVA